MKTRHPLDTLGPHMRTIQGAFPEELHDLPLLDHGIADIA